MTAPPSRSIERAGLAALSLLLFTTIGTLLLHGVGLPISIAVIVGLVVAAGGAVFVHRHAPADVDGRLRARPIATTLFTSCALIALLRFAGAATYLLSPTPDHQWMAAYPKSFWVHHSCASAYFTGSEVAQTSDPYAPDRYWAELPSPKFPPGKPKLIGSFAQDAYEYPPQFLLLPAFLRLFVDDFVRFNALWAGLQTLLVLFAVFALGRHASSPRSVRPLAAMVAMLLSPANLLAIHEGNFQLSCVAASVLAMLALAKERRVLGGALLGFLVCAKIYPGILVLYLLFRRRWADFAAVAVSSVIVTGVTALVYGLQPFVSFVHQLPALSSGAAFATLGMKPFAYANMSMFGFVMKLNAIDVPGMTLAAGARAAWVYTLLLVPITYLAARGQRTRGDESVVWLALLGLGTLRSPLLPIDYGLFVPMWILVQTAVVLPAERLRGWRASLWIVAWVLLAVPTFYLYQRIGSGVAVSLVPWLLCLYLFGSGIVRRQHATDA